MVGGRSFRFPLAILLGRVDPRQQVSEIVDFIEPVDAPKPLSEDRKILSGQKSHRGHPLWGSHLFYPSGYAKLLVRVDL